LIQAVEKYKEYDGWREFYPEAQEELPTGMPLPVTEKMAQITIMVDADHAHCEVTRRCSNKTPQWYHESEVD
jgi:hypothetical protein